MESERNVQFVKDIVASGSKSGTKKELPCEMTAHFQRIVDEAINSERVGDYDRRNRIGLEESQERFINGYAVVSEPVSFIPEIKSKIDPCHEESIDNLMLIPSYRRAKETNEEIQWRKMATIVVGQGITEWLDQLENPQTKRAYSMAMQELCKKGLIDKNMSLQSFSMRNHNNVVDEIMKGDLFSEIKVTNKEKKERVTIHRPWSKATRQQRAAAFISFSGYLCRTHDGIIQKALPKKVGEGKTFKRVRNQVKTKAFACRRDWMKFFKELERINTRDALIGKLQLQGGRRISEVLGLRTETIDFDKREITYFLSKTKGTEDTAVITYSQEIMNELKTYLQGREGLVFISSKRNPIFPQHIERNFSLAGKRAGVDFKVTSHVLRATCVTYLKQEGFSDSDIQKITGHSSSEMVRMYDKSARADNVSKKINLV
jgi:integrase